SEPSLPTLTTDFAEFAIPWEQSFAASAAQQQITPPQLTTFAESTTPQDWSTLIGTPPAQEPIAGPAGAIGTPGQRLAITGSLLSAADAPPSMGLPQLPGTVTLPGTTGPQIGN